MPVPMLIVTAGTRACAIPVETVVETMRPLPIERVAAAPPFVLGVAIVRGAPVPVVDLHQLVFGNESVGVTRDRFVTLAVESRSVALAVTSVVGVKSVDRARIGELPPLLAHAASDLVDAIGTADAQLLTVLRASRLIPDAAAWAEIDREPAAR